MSKIADVLRNKNRVERAREAKRRERLADMRLDALFKAKLRDEFRNIEILLDSEEVDAVIVRVPEEHIARFGASIYSEDLAEYDIQQVDGAADEFYIRKRFLEF